MSGRAPRERGPLPRPPVPRRGRRPGHPLSRGARSRCGTGGWPGPNAPFPAYRGIETTGGGKGPAGRAAGVDAAGPGAGSRGLRPRRPLGARSRGYAFLRPQQLREPNPRRAGQTASSLQGRSGHVAAWWPGHTPRGPRGHPESVSQRGLRLAGGARQGLPAAPACRGHRGSPGPRGPLRPRRRGGSWAARAGGTASSHFSPTRNTPTAMQVSQSIMGESRVCPPHPGSREALGRHASPSAASGSGEGAGP